MIHYFNPGHETAILSGAKYFQHKTNVITIQKQLSYLPIWYASQKDFVLVDYLDYSFMEKIKNIYPINQIISLSNLFTEKSKLLNQEIDFWGISPQIINYFKHLNNDCKINLHLPSWKYKLKILCNRLTSTIVLSNLIDKIPNISPDILPCFFTNLKALTYYIKQSKRKIILKSPYSSSGRGLIWTSSKEITSKTQQIINGILKKQQIISAEKALNKQLDFSMQFKITHMKSVQFIGYSIFYTNQKGNYKSSLIICQKMIEKQITYFIKKKLLHKVKNHLIQLIKEKYTHDYVGHIGVDMLIYSKKKQYHLHPCVEINMRKSMGYLAVCIQQNYIHFNKKGVLTIDYHPLDNEILQIDHKLEKQFPLKIKNGKITSGYLPLSPIKKDSHYHAYLKINL